MASPIAATGAFTAAPSAGIWPRLRDRRTPPARSSVPPRSTDRRHPEPRGRPRRPPISALGLQIRLLGNRDRVVPGLHLTIEVLQVAVRLAPGETSPAPRDHHFLFRLPGAQLRLLQPACIPRSQSGQVRLRVTSAPLPVPVLRGAAALSAQRRLGSRVGAEIEVRPPLRPDPVDEDRLPPVGEFGGREVGRGIPRTRFAGQGKDRRRQRGQRQAVGGSRPSRSFNWRRPAASTRSVSWRSAVSKSRRTRAVRRSAATGSPASFPASMRSR